MSIELILFCSIVGIFALLQALSAHPLSASKTVYQLTDRISWIIGGLLAIGIGFWKPWFTGTWWKALLFSPVLLISMSSFVQLLLGSLLTIDTRDKIRIVSRLITLMIFVVGVFLFLRSCGE